MKGIITSKMAKVLSSQLCHDILQMLFLLCSLAQSTWGRWSGSLPKSIMFVLTLHLKLSY